jgi:hypothetical protein
MPLVDNKITRGKGWFKLLHYMGLVIVSVASPITINKEIVSNGDNSFLCENDSEWNEVLTQILLSKIDLELVGKAARKTVCEEYTFNANWSNYYKFIVH